MALASATTETSATPAPSQPKTFRQLAEEGLEFTSNFIEKRREIGVDLRQADIKFAEAENAFVRSADPKLEQTMLALTKRLCDEARQIAWGAMNRRVAELIAQAEDYPEQYRSEYAQRLISGAKLALDKRGQMLAFVRVGQAIQVMETGIDAQKAEEKRSENRLRLAGIREEAKRCQAENRAHRAEENRSRAKSFGAGTKKN